MTELSPQDISHLSRLARLNLTEEEIARYAQQLTSVVGYVEQLAQVDTSKISQIKGVTGLHNVFAGDQPRSVSDLAQINQEDVLSGAPLREKDFFLVRAVLEDDAVGA